MTSATQAALATNEIYMRTAVAPWEAPSGEPLTERAMNTVRGWVISLGRIGIATTLRP